MIPVAIVTGAGRRRGIGRAIALQLAGEGFAVVVHERTSDPASRPPHEVEAGWLGAASVVREIEVADGRAVAVAGDIADREMAERLASAAAELGAISALVHNAGTAGEANRYLAHETPDDVWDDTLRINITSAHRLTSVLVPLLATSDSKNRSIVHLSSTAGHRALPRYGAYCASKAAVELLTEQQAVELARFGIRVNCVAPGSTSTDMIDGTLARAAERAGVTTEQLRASVTKGIPLRRFAEPGEVAAVVAFLVSGRASYVTGQVITVDGGMSLV